MLERLLESRARKTRYTGGTIASITAHTALIAAAVFATAQARDFPARRAETVRPIYFPSPASSQTRVRSAPRPANRPQPATAPRMIFVDPIKVSVPTAVDLSDLVSRTTDFPRGIGAPADDPHAHGIGEDISGTTFSAEQVEKQAALAPGNQPPRYPEALRSAGIAGSVTALFVVDAAGRVEEGSVRFVRSDNPLFEDAVRSALKRMRFIPATVGGTKVRQLVQMPFVFTLSR